MGSNARSLIGPSTSSERQRRNIMIPATRRLACTFALALFALLVQPTTAADAAQDRPAELKPLERWIGTWDLEITVKPGGWMPEGSKGVFVSTITWDLNGRFLRCDAKGHTTAGNGPKRDDAFLWMCTYEPQRQAYQSWVFWSPVGGQWGAAPVATGTWDEAKQTLTTESEEGGTTSLSITRWLDADTHEFHSTFKDGNGRVMMEQVGKAKRKK
jgi:hypothetical protein